MATDGRGGFKGCGWVEEGKEFQKQSFSAYDLIQASTKRFI